MNEEKDTLEEIIRCEYYQHAAYLKSISDTVNNIEESEVRGKRYTILSKKHGSKKRLEDLEEIEKREQHQKTLEKKYGSGIAYGVLRLFERYEELNVASPKKDIVRIEEIEKIIINLLFLRKNVDLGLSFEQTKRNKILHNAFIKKYRLESKLNEVRIQQNEKNLAREREEKRTELERKYGKGKSLEELIKLESDEKRRIELEGKYGKGKSLEALERLERIEKLRIEEENRNKTYFGESRQYWNDLYG